MQSLCLFSWSLEYTLHLFLQQHVSSQPGPGHISAGNNIGDGTHSSTDKLSNYSSLPFCTQQYRTSIEYSVKPKPTVNQAQAESTTRRQLVYGIQDDNGTDIQNFALDLTPPPDIVVRTREGTSDGMNVLGIVIFSATMGEKEGRACFGIVVRPS